MDQKSYVRLLEQSVSATYNAPVGAQRIRDWNGKGNLPDTSDDPNLDKLVGKINKMGDVDDTEDMENVKGPSKPKYKKITESPVSMLEDRANRFRDKVAEEEEEELATEGLPIHGEYTEEGFQFDKKESEILSRLIQEMSDLDAEIETSDTEDEPLLDKSAGPGYGSQIMTSDVPEMGTEEDNDSEEFADDELENDDELEDEDELEEDEESENDEDIDEDEDNEDEDFE